MRYIKNIVFLLVVTSTAFLQSCNNYLDVNTDPNNPTEVSIDLVLPAAQISVTVFARGAEISTLGGFWAQYYTQSPDCGQHVDIDALRITTTWADRLWLEVFAGGLNDLKYIYENTDNTSYKLITEVLSCYTFQLLVDVFDKVPYSEALRGTEIKAPKYDDGEDIYVDLLRRIDDAVAAYESNPGGAVSGDVILNGDMDAWVRFANSLKLKILMRMSYSDIARNNDALLLAQTGDFILDDVELIYTGTANPIFANEKGAAISCDNWRASKSLILYLDSLEDTRISAIYNPSVAGGLFTGNLQGNNNLGGGATQNNNFSTSNIKATDPSILMSTVEVGLFRAEAEARFGSAATAKTLYDQAVSDDFAKRDAGSAADFIGVDGVYEFPEGGSTEDQVKAIAYQRWIAMANIANIEGFLERNRTGYPDYHPSGTPIELTDAERFGLLTHHARSALPVGQNPKRVWFPNISVRSNSNTPSQASSLAVKVWWDNK